MRDHDSETGSRPVATILLVDSVDIACSIGREGFLEGRLRSGVSTAPAIDVRSVPGGRCDVVAQRLGASMSPERIGVPAGLQEWFSHTTAVIHVPETISLLVMSMADAVTEVVWRHRAAGVLVQTPMNREVTWSREQNEWLLSEFVEVPPDSETMSNAIRSIAEHLDPFDAGFVIFNVSTFIPAEKAYWFRVGEPETRSIRSGRVNLVVEGLVSELGVTLVDVDRVTAELGAGSAVVAPVRYSMAALDSISEEATAAILDLPNISRDFASEVMSLSVPRYDRRTINGTLTRWHVDEETWIAKGDQLFDIRFHGISSRLNASRDHSDRSISMSVVAGRDGFVDRIMIREGSQVGVGTLVGVIVASEGVERGGGPVRRFPIGVTIDRMHGDV